MTIDAGGVEQPRDDVLATVRREVHALNNQLALVIGIAELLPNSRE